MATSMPWNDLIETMIQILSWEFIFTLNLVGIALLPFLRRLLPPRFPLFIISFLLPLFLLFAAWCFAPYRDLWFYLKLYVLHWGISLGSLALLFRMLGPSVKLWKIYATLFGSLLLTTLGFLLTPALTALDPFWGVIPGTFSLDPQIHLNVHINRLVVWLHFVALVLIWGLWTRFSPRIWLAFFGIHLLLAWIQPMPMTLRARYETFFVEEFADSQFKIFRELKESSPWSNQSWLEEFRFLESEILSQAPSKNIKKRNHPLTIFIYDSPQSKYRLLGAQNVQVGNFLRDEMHLSQIELGDDILRHELVHLLQPQFDAPLTAYFDPFIFEGLAVSLGRPAGSSIEMAAALIQEISKTQPFSWPRGVQFYSQFSGPVAYRLAGGYADQALLQNQFPWDAKIDSQRFSSITVSPSTRLLAQKNLEGVALLKDPLARDCERAFNFFEQTRSFSGWKSLLPLCDRSRLAYKGVFMLSADRSFALELLKDSAASQNLARGDLAVLRQDPDQAIKEYEKSKSRDAELRILFLKYRGAAQLSEILLQSKDPRESILSTPEIFRDPRMAELWLASHSILKRHELTTLISKVRQLTSEERLQSIRSRFYQALAESASTQKRTEQIQALDREMVLAGFKDDEFRRRLAWALKSAL